jgi:hypothetical protein
VEQFKYLGIIQTNQNSIYEGIKSRLNSGNALLSFGAKVFVFDFVIQTLRIKICRTIILLFVLYGCESWLFTVREEHNVRIGCCGEYLDLRGTW